MHWHLSQIKAINSDNLIHLAGSSSCISEHPGISITHGISGLGASPGVPYAADCVQHLTLTTISSKVEDEPRSGREEHDSNSGLTVVNPKLADDSPDKVEASSEVSFAIGLNAS